MARVTDADFYPLEYAARILPQGMAIVGMISGMFEPVCWLMGYRNLALALYDQPDLMQSVIDRLREIYIPLAGNLVQMDRVMGLWMGDDMGFRSSTLISPDHLRRYISPTRRRSPPSPTSRASLSSCTPAETWRQ